MALKKSELYSSIWSSCDELRGGMDASQDKDYVLVLRFVKYISDKYAGPTVRASTIWSSVVTSRESLGCHRTCFRAQAFPLAS
jgi:hypothetical protein